MAKRILLLSDSIGDGSDELGRILMKNFIYSLARSDERPSAVLMMNGAVRLACEGSDSLDDLSLLAAQGVSIRACGTCLDFLGLAGALKVGEVGTMPSTVASVMGGDEIVTVA